MKTFKHSEQGQIFTDIVLKIFHINGRLISCGDELTAPYGLTSARWQVLGALADGPAPASHIARKMGLTRQSVQRLVNILVDDGFVVTQENPHHRKSPLLHLSPKGQKKFENIVEAWSEIANTVAKGFTAKELQQTLAIIHLLSERISNIDKDKFE